ncbi:hypothetical protein ACEWY4_025370 [Coilia grayii]|uniref:MARVEL domain-containing protein n=1 Tax=Coilia grayii TaxID=363190 RepID=A0ABD1J0F7_9TELE
MNHGDNLFILQFKFTPSSTDRFQIILGLVPLLLLTLGAMHLHDCPKEPMVPIYVIVGSSFFLFLQLIALCGCGTLCLIPVLLVFIFLFIWLITGSVFVYRAFKPNFESKRSPEYCEKILYDAAFWCTNLAWVAMALCGTLALCRQVYRCISERELKDDTEAGRSPSPEEEGEEDEEEKEEEKEVNSPLSDKVKHLPQTTPQNTQPKTPELSLDKVTVDSEAKI